MTRQNSSRVALALGAVALLTLGGCAVVPMDGYDVGAPVAYPAGPVYGAPYVATPAYPVYSAPYYAAPSVSLGVYGGWSNDHHYWHDRPPRPGWGGGPPPRPGWGGNPPPRPGWGGNPGHGARPPAAPPRPMPPGWPRPSLGGRGHNVDGGG